MQDCCNILYLDFAFFEIQHLQTDVSVTCRVSSIDLIRSHRSTIRNKKPAPLWQKWIRQLHLGHRELT